VGGLYGIVQSIDEEGDLIVEIADGIHVRLARRSVATVVKPEDEDEGEHEHRGEAGAVADDETPGAEAAGGPHSVDDRDASLEATQRRLFGRRR
jgi:hypothetical protein